MQPKILLTSFQTWLPHQQSNSADELLGIIQKQPFLDAELIFLRKLIVDIELASMAAIAKIKEHRPHGIICCGMAESRKLLSIESNATCQEDCLFTSVDLALLTSHLSYTAISHDAGKFVCEGLYYRVLAYLHQHNLVSPCIFVHVPVLSDDNLDSIDRDFSSIITFMVNCVSDNN